MEHTTETITSTITVLRLTDQDLDQLRADPWGFGEALRDRIAPNGANGNGKHKPGPHQQHKVGRPARKAKGGQGKGHGAGGAFQKVECPECHQPIAKSQLNNHMAKKHGAPATAAAAE